MKALLLFTLLTLPLTVFSWGGRGHHAICEAATFLVQEKGLATSLQHKPHIMGHLCNIPDTHWRNLGPEASKQGDAAHYVDVEVLPVSFQEIPLDYKKIIESYTGQKNPVTGKPLYSVPTEFGSNWWRADQFYRRAVSQTEAFKAPPPANRKEEQNDDLPFNKVSHDFYVNLGIMGHFVGDNAQPFHLTIDYDGYRAGHGGIHAYYEDAIVGTLPYNLTAKIVEHGRKLQKQAKSKNKKDLQAVKFLNEKTLVEKMKALGEISLSEVPKVFALDPIKKKSELKEEKGMSLKTPAERASAETVSAKYEPMIVAQMARSAALLAQLWDQAYVEVGRPQLGAYKSYKFPFTPDFVAPDYFDLKILEKKNQ